MKKNLLSLFAVVVALAASAFTLHTTKQIVEEDTYYYGYDEGNNEYKLIESVTNPQDLPNFCIFGSKECIRVLVTEEDPELTISVEEADQLDPLESHPMSQFNFAEYENQ